MRCLIVIAMVFGCSSDEPAGKTSHPSMPNQFEVGSTINAKYRVVKKLGDTREYAVFAVEHVGLADRELTLIAPRGSTPIDTTAWNVAEVDRTPDGKPYVVAELSDAEVRDVLAGAQKL